MTTTKDHLESALMEAESREKKDKARLKELDRTLTDFSSDNKSAQVRLNHLIHIVAVYNKIPTIL